MSVPTAPQHLSKPSKALYRRLVSEYDLAREPHVVEVLRLACEALDRGEEARLTIARDGAYSPDRFGQIRPHPALAIERDSRIAATRCFRELSLDSDVPEARLPRVGGGRS